MRDPQREHALAGAIVDRLPARARGRVVAIVSTLACGDLCATAIVDGCRSVTYPSHGQDDEDVAATVAAQVERIVLERDRALAA